MDPTPASGVAPSPSGWESLQHIGESFRLHWDRLFIRYSARDQLAVVYSLRDSSDSARDIISHWVRALSAAASVAVDHFEARARAAGPLALGFLAILPGAGVALLILLVRKRWQYGFRSSRPTVRTQQQIAHLYRTMLDIAARKGVVSRPSTTPMEFVQMVGREWAEAQSMVAGVTALYCQGRFSGSTLSREELARAVEQIGTLQQLARAPR